ncbi:calcium:proton antiporter [Myroides odoratimimus]|uniref:calcium:proton antiporter n=1 Tax=Myroides odoratimimus TaxID=76832 RepID=UPI002577B83D|nr:calcium:proton antiporter [Myroides odoratimimus]MDM1097743.1 calcium:proton antiporter [Myroides odoratimimus]MDM1328122.1 calcium:proton antiporter [Myroides odoratimimus]MDM1444708.1 calcium:proton antiporter [Myroides odoratimimus]MDM1454684.1 calcium:proton antiporter [Myroides odoratimimus]MDM1478407.1 calcium:proton antiporter [Myroides odoratimimus]
MTQDNVNKGLSLASIFPTKTRIRLAVVWLIVILFMLFGSSITGESLSPLLATSIFLILLFTIVGAAFGVVKEADELAHKLGEPFGTLILTLSIVSIEVILISAVMLGPGENPTIGKDSIFSVMMIIMNLVIGLCILLGGLKYGEQEYNAQGTMSYLAMIIMLGGIGLMLPNFIQGAGGGMFSDIQAIVLAVFIIILYAVFLFFQMKGYKHLYVQPLQGSMEIPFKDRTIANVQSAEEVQSKGEKSEIWIRSIILIGMILPIVLLSHNMAVVVDYGIKAANLPTLLGGVLVAIIVFTPESMTAVKAALNNEFQRAINLCHGAFVSTVGLTVPSVLIIGLITGKTVLFGMNSTETILFVITLLLSLMTFLGKRTTPIMGIMHLMLFAVFTLLIFYP